MQTAPTTAWARLGYVLNWAGIVAGLGFGTLLWVALDPMALGWHVIIAGAGFLFCYAIGRAARYVLAGR
jgi:hypothetical protein